MSGAYCKGYTSWKPNQTADECLARCSDSEYFYMKNGNECGCCPDGISNPEMNRSYAIFKINDSTPTTNEPTAAAATTIAEPSPLVEGRACSDFGYRLGYIPFTECLAKTKADPMRECSKYFNWSRGDGNCMCCKTGEDALDMTFESSGMGIYSTDQTNE